MKINIANLFRDMDDDELSSDGQSIYGESDDEFQMNSEDDNSGSGEVISLLEYYNTEMLYVVRAPVYYNMVYLVSFFRIQIPQMMILIVMKL